MKTFGKFNCKLCMNERIAIKKPINTNSEIYGACGHRQKFHRYTCCLPSAEEEQLSSKRDKMEGCEGNPLVPFIDITNIFVCKKVDKIAISLMVQIRRAVMIVYKLMC